MHNINTASHKNNPLSRIFFLIFFTSFNHVNVNELAVPVFFPNYRLTVSRQISIFCQCPENRPENKPENKKEQGMNYQAVFNTLAATAIMGAISVFGANAESVSEADGTYEILLPIGARFKVISKGFADVKNGNITTRRFVVEVEQIR